MKKDVVRKAWELIRRGVDKSTAFKMAWKIEAGELLEESDIEVIIDDKVYTASAILTVPDSWEGLKGYHISRQSYVTIDGIEFTYYNSGFSNISDYIIVGDDRGLYSEDPLELEFGYDVYYRNREFDIERIEQSIENLESELEELEEAEDIKEAKEEIERLESELEEAREEQENFDFIYEKLDRDISMAINNLGLGASSTDDSSYREVVIDVENGIAIEETRDSLIVTEDLTWVEDFLIGSYNNFIDTRIIDYIVENRDFFDIEIVK